MDRRSNQVARPSALQHQATHGRAHGARTPSYLLRHRERCAASSALRAISGGDEVSAQHLGDLAMRVQSGQPSVRRVLRTGKIEGSWMRHIVWFSILLAIDSSVALASQEQCVSIKSRVDRLTCYDRQASDAKEGPKTGYFKRPIDDPLEQWKLEDERVAKRLQGICRGC